VASDKVHDFCHSEVGLELDFRLNNTSSQKIHLAHFVIFDSMKDLSSAILSLPPHRSQLVVLHRICCSSNASQSTGNPFLKIDQPMFGQGLLVVFVWRGMQVLLRENTPISGVSSLRCHILHTPSTQTYSATKL
jgi:hypothetical protein